MKSTALGVRLSQSNPRHTTYYLWGPGQGTSEKAMAPHSSTLAWKSPWTEEPGRLQSMGSQKSLTWLSDFTFTFHFHALEKEMATLQCSCLENPRDRGVWWAAVCGVAQSQTWLKQLSSSSSSSSNSSSSRARYLTSNHLNLSLVKWG